MIAQPKRQEADRLTAELATYGISPKQPDGPKLVKGQERETLDKAASVSAPIP